MRAHPRVGGENPLPAWTSEKSPGSSPRGRGKLHAELLAEIDNGLIPAWAGKTRPSTSRRVRFRAHPRVGGENEENGQNAVWFYGSSPRGRGKRLRPHARGTRRGLIPAWAGKTSAGTGFVKM